MRSFKVLGVTVALMLGAAPTVQAQYIEIYTTDTRYGVIAVSSGGTALVYGLGTNYVSSRQAANAAQRDCRKKSAQKCVLAVTFIDACGALASGADGKWVAVKTKYREDVKAAALSRCQEDGLSGCQVEVVACADDV